MKKIYFLGVCAALGLHGQAQMVIQAGSTVFLESGAKLTVQGDLTSSSNIQGTGTVVMKGTALQNITMNGNTIPKLEIDNLANVALSGSAARISTDLLFTNGKLLTADQDLIIGSSATITGNNASRFIWTSGTGQVKKELTADIASYEIPVGENNNYRPAYITASGGSYAAGANIGVRNAAGASLNRPPSIASFVSTYWPVTKSGISGGTQTVTTQYNDGTDVTGTEGNLKGYFFNGTDWSSVNGTNDAAANRISSQIVAATGEITAMNKFVAVGAKVYLLGAYINATTEGLMNDQLRNPAPVVIPVNDPYRATPYSATFTHRSNPITEMVAPSVFATQPTPGDNIVDWVFLQLRDNGTSPSTIIQTRSALLQRDGDIVDVDGVSPVTFNTVADGNYTLSVRHRNHLGLSTNPASPRSITEARSLALTGNNIDFRTATAAQLFGTGGYATASHPALGTINLLWAGDVSGNGIVRYLGTNGPTGPNDRSILLQDLNNNESGIIPSSYQRGDVNMNKITRYIGTNGPTGPNDRSFLLQYSLGNAESAFRNQTLPTPAN